PDQILYQVAPAGFGDGSAHRGGEVGNRIDGGGLIAITQPRQHRIDREDRITGGPDGDGAVAGEHGEDLLEADPVHVLHALHHLGFGQAPVLLEEAPDPEKGDGVGRDDVEYRFVASGELDSLGKGGGEVDPDVSVVDAETEGGPSGRGGHARQDLGGHRGHVGSGEGGFVVGGEHQQTAVR